MFSYEKATPNKSLDKKCKLLGSVKKLVALLKKINQDKNFTIILFIP